MNRWFRWYEGTTEDGKFRVTARNASVTVRDVIALWAFLLEDASSYEHRGVCVRKEDFMASVLDFEDGVVERTLAAMEDQGMISVGPGAITITNWATRQFETDTKDNTNAERQRRWRENKKQPPSKRERNGTVTEEKLPDTDTDTDTEKKERLSGANAPRRSPDDFEKFWVAYPRTPVMSKKQAKAEWGKLSQEDREAAASAVQPFREWLAKQKDHPIVHACRFLSQRRFEGFDASVEASVSSRNTWVCLMRGSAEFEAWEKFMGKKLATNRYGGRYFPSEHPPSNETAA